MAQYVQRFIPDSGWLGSPAGGWTPDNMANVPLPPAPMNPQPFISPAPRPATPNVTPNMAPAGKINWLDIARAPWKYAPRYAGPPVSQEAANAPMFRPGRNVHGADYVGNVHGADYVRPQMPRIGQAGPSPTGQPQPSQPPQPGMGLGNFYTPVSPGDVQNIGMGTLGANFLGNYLPRRMN